MQKKRIELRKGSENRKIGAKGVGMSANPIFRAGFYTFVIAFICGMFACTIVHRQSVGRVEAVRFSHLRATGSLLAKTIKLADHEKIDLPTEVDAPQYRTILAQFRKVIKSDASVRFISTLRPFNGKFVYVVDSGGGMTMTVGDQWEGDSKLLTEALRTKKPVFQSSPVFSSRGRLVGAYVPVMNGKGKVVTVIAIMMRQSDYSRDIEALDLALSSSLLFTFAFALAVAGVVALFTWNSGRTTIELSQQVVQATQRLHRTEGELILALENARELSQSLVQTLWTAGCLIWNGSASNQSGEFVWVAELKCDPGFPWLTSALRKNPKFDEVWTQFKTEEDRANWERVVAFSIGSKLSSTVVEYQVQPIDSEPRWFEEQLHFRYDDDGTVWMDAFVQDITEKKSRNQEVFRLAYFDTVTGLINRTRIHQILNELLVDKRHTCLIGIEISNFRNINESWGADVGDKVLKDLAEKLTEGAGSHGIVGRLAGDDFVIIVPDEHSLSWMVTRIDEVCQKPSVVEGIEVAKICRLGYTTAEVNDSAVSMIRKTNLALEYARKNQAQFPIVYKPEMSFRAKMRVELETSMRQALMDREFYLMFQPIYCNRTQKIVKAEALLRWNSSRFGPVSPGTFIPIAEESDFINDLGNYVIDETAKAIAKLSQETSYHHLVVSVNLSLQQLKTNAILNVFNAVLDRWSISPKNLLIEITESSIMHDSSECDVMLRKLQERGFSLAIDDFGTGYSSLATLASLPFDTLKIDKRFVDGIGMDKKQEEVLSTIIRLARALNLQIVAEGIETQSQFLFLQEMQVEYSQGYFFGKPLPFEDLVARVRGDYGIAA